MLRCSHLHQRMSHQWQSSFRSTQGCFDTSQKMLMIHSIQTGWRPCHRCCHKHHSSCLEPQSYCQQRLLFLHSRVHRSIVGCHQPLQSVLVFPCKLSLHHSAISGFHQLHRLGTHARSHRQSHHHPFRSTRNHSQTHRRLLSLSWL